MYCMLCPVDFRCVCGGAVLIFIASVGIQDMVLSLRRGLILSMFFFGKESNNKALYFKEVQCVDNLQCHQEHRMIVLKQDVALR